MNKNGLLLVFIGLLGGVIVLSQIDALRTRERAGELVARLNGAELAVKAQNLQIDMIQALYAAQGEALANAREKGAKAELFYSEREQKAHQLDAGQNVRQWRGRRVPDAVKRLYEHPGCANAADCYQSMRAGDTLPRAGDQNGDK